MFRIWKPMIRTYTPCRPLSDFVESLWLHQGYHASDARERVLPTGALELVFDLNSNADGGALISGARSTSFIIETHRATSVMGVDFAPGGAHPFFTAPVGEFRDALVPLGAVWGHQAVDLRERLAEAPTADQKFRILETALLDRATRPLERHPAVSTALVEFLRKPHASSIGAMARQVGLSPRRFIQIFRDEVGLPPKLFCRVRRFQRVLALTERREKVDWANVAVFCGYADQAHLIRDFREFSGLIPTAYLAGRGGNPNHVPVVG
jgi:AraC-like DNA-binding protein